MFNFKNRVLKLIIVLVSFLVFTFTLLGLFCFILEIKYTNKIYSDVYVGGINIGGKTLIEAKKVINEKLDVFNQEGITFVYEGNEVIVYPINSSSDAAVVDALIDFRVNDIVDEAMLVGRSGNFIADTMVKFEPFFNKNYYISVNANFDNTKIIDYLKQEFEFLEPENAIYYFDQEGSLLIDPGKMGDKIDYQKAMINLKNNLDDFNFSNIALEGLDAEPEILEEDCLRVKDDVISILDLSPIKLKYNKSEWIISKESFLKMITLFKKDNNVIVVLDKEKIRKYIEEKVVVEINQDPVLPKFTLNEGKVENFEPGREGRKLDADLTINLLVDLISNPFKELDLSVNELSSSDNKEENKDILGIKEIIGNYTLAFEGSTSARISNIKNGAKFLNGLLLKPGEEFSMLKALGSIDEEHGYMKEAVIKDNAISYEFGGGLCHTSTTLFRTVLDAGLPITMRHNHSYNMPYYQPAGIDATIYDPYPDFKFINDTKNHILIQAKANNKEMTIELWGVKDGRVVTKIEPVIYDIVKPKPTKIIMTYTLSSGQRKCTYAAYDGADAYFDYEVAYADGTVKKERFSSHYIPRQGVCLVGI